MTARTVKEYRKQALQYLVPALGKRKIRDVTRLDVETTVEPLPKVQRHRALGQGERVRLLVVDRHDAVQGKAELAQAPAWREVPRRSFHTG